MSRLRDARGPKYRPGGKETDASCPLLIHREVSLVPEKVKLEEFIL